MIIILLDIKLGAMNKVEVPILCWFNCKLTIDQKNKPIYVAGTVKPMSVWKKTTSLELVEKIHHISKINPNNYQIQITCKWSFTYGYYQAVVIADDEDTRAMFQLYPSVNTIELYMEKVQGEFSCMLDLDNESTGFMSPVPHIPHVDMSIYTT